MIHIHPFPARMAPEIALQGLSKLPRDSLVVDPMSGSGMVIGTASKLGLNAIGYDLDPLACMISSVNGTIIDAEKVKTYCNEILHRCLEIDPNSIELSWIDNDPETRQYIDFWFAPKQKAQLRSLAYLLVEKPFISSKIYLNALKIALSRLIITKEPKASLARDTAHSRPHRTIMENTFDIYEAFPGSVEHLLAALKPKKILQTAKIFRGDARRMGRLRDSSIDCIVTSPPYLNAIDYMRGHRLSLVWMEHGVSELRKIRARSVGTEVSKCIANQSEVDDFFRSLSKNIDKKSQNMLRRYYADLRDVTKEARRIIKCPLKLLDLRTC